MAQEAAASADSEQPDPTACEHYTQMWKKGELKTIEVLKSPFCGPLPRLIAQQNPGVVVINTPKGGQAALARRLVAKLSPDDMKALSKLGQITYSTVCSGTDLAVNCNNAFAHAVCEAETSGAIEFRHVWACEKDQCKQNFIMKMHPGCPSVFEDTADLKGILANDRITNTEQIIEKADGLIGGFPCTDVARVNVHCHNEGNLYCVAAGTHRMGDGKRGGGSREQGGGRRGST